MARIFRVTTEWSGFRGGPGYTNFFFRNYLPGGAPTSVDDQASALGARERTIAFFGAIAPFIPNDVTFSVDTLVDALNDADGALEDSFTAGEPGTMGGLSSAKYSAASGICIGWTTSEIRRRRRIRGRTFLVPFAGDQYTEGGRIDNYAVTNIQEAARDLAIGGVNSTFGVWARPTVTGASDGVWAECTGVRVTDSPAILRSRRD